MSELLTILYLGLPLAVACAVTCMRPPERPPGRSTRAQFLLAVVAYPATVALVLHWLGGRTINVGTIALFALPGLAFGALLGRMWIVGVPPAAGAITLLIGDSMDPSCTN